MAATRRAFRRYHAGPGGQDESSTYRRLMGTVYREADGGILEEVEAEGVEVVEVEGRLHAIHEY